jgi:hypothetical protein
MDVCVYPYLCYVHGLCAGTFYMTWLYVFDYAFGSYMFYDLAGVYLLS